MAEFTIGGNKYKVKAPTGRKGREASAFALKMFSDYQKEVRDAERDEKDETVLGFVQSEKLVALATNAEFEEKYLSSFLGVPQEVLDKEGTLGEILSALMVVIVLPPPFFHNNLPTLAITKDPATLLLDI